MTNKQGQVVNTTLLPEDDKVVIHATKGFNVSEYKWQYATRKDSTWTNGGWNYTYNWQAVPRSIAPDSVFTANAKDLLGADLSSYYRKNVYIRMELSCNRWTPIMTLAVTPSAPHIESAVYDMPACHGTSNGWIRLKFDRPLLNGEVLYYSLTQNRETNNTPLVVDPITREALIEGLPSGSYYVSLLGTLPINGRTAYTFTEGEKHYLSHPRPSESQFYHRTGSRALQRGYRRTHLGKG